MNTTGYRGRKRNLSQASNDAGEGCSWVSGCYVTLQRHILSLGCRLAPFGGDTRPNRDAAVGQLLKTRPAHMHLDDVRNRLSFNTCSHVASFLRCNTTQGLGPRFCCWLPQKTTKQELNNESESRSMGDGHRTRQNSKDHQDDFLYARYRIPLSSCHAYLLCLRIG